MKCKTHHRDLECMGGCSAHPSNWYCPECDKDKQIAELKAENARLSEELSTQTAAMESQGKVLRKAMDEIEGLKQEVTDQHDISYNAGLAAGEKKGIEQHVEFIINHYEAVLDGPLRLADALCDFWPEVSRFHIHARVFKYDMRDTLADYITKAIRKELTNC